MGLQPGTVLRGRYEITRIIKSGGMGSVCEAIDNNLAKSPCAIKEILESALSGPDAEYVQATFENEMKALVNLDHPGIPKVRDYFHEGDRRYIVMDFVKGQSLDDEIREAMQEHGTGLLPGKVVNDVLALLEIVEYLHKLSPPILHRDIKPPNIIRDERTGRIKLVDFGLAKALNETFSPQTMVGTMGYCPPEQLSGKVERRSDLYAVGATLYHMLTGKVPQLSFDPLLLEMPQLRPGLDRIVERATQVRVGERFATAADMSAELKAWQSDLSGAPSKVISRPVAVDPYPFADNSSPSTVVQPTSNSGQWAWAAVAAMALGIGLLGGKMMTQPSSTASPSLIPVPLASSSAAPSPSSSPQNLATQPPEPRPKPAIPRPPAPPHSDPGPPRPPHSDPGPPRPSHSDPGPPELPEPKPAPVAQPKVDQPTSYPQGTTPQTEPKVEPQEPNDPVATEPPPDRTRPFRKVVRPYQQIRAGNPDLNLPKNPRDMLPGGHRPGRRNREH